MALFTDDSVITADDLREFEAGLTQVAATHAIDIPTTINLAKGAVSDKVMIWLLNAGGSDPQAGNRRALGMSTVVLTPALGRWLCFESLARVFAEAYNVQLNTRYQGKWNEYKQEARNAAELFFLSGVGVVDKPLPRPATPLLSLQAGTAPAQTFYIETAWVSDRGEESATSVTGSVAMPANSGLVVGMAEGALRAPEYATGWNVYAGTALDQLTKQNVTPLAIGSTWQLPTFGLQVGSLANGGQVPNTFVTLGRRIKRG